MRKKISVTLDAKLLDSLHKEAQKENLSVSRLIENKLKEAK